MTHCVTYLPEKEKVTQCVTNCLFASKYKLYLPTEKELKEELEREKRMIEMEFKLLKSKGKKREGKE